MLDKLLLQIASDLCSFCHLGNFLGEIPAGRKGNNLFMAVREKHVNHPSLLLLLLFSRVPTAKQSLSGLVSASLRTHAPRGRRQHWMANTR